MLTAGVSFLKELPLLGRGWACRVLFRNLRPSLCSIEPALERRQFQSIYTGECMGTCTGAFLGCFRLLLC